MFNGSVSMQMRCSHFSREIRSEILRSENRKWPWEVCVILEYEWAENAVSTWCDRDGVWVIWEHDSVKHTGTSIVICSILYFSVIFVACSNFHGTLHVLIGQITCLKVNIKLEIWILAKSIRNLILDIVDCIVWFTTCLTRDVHAFQKLCGDEKWKN